MTGAFLISLFDSIPLWVMVLPIVACSVISLAVIIERSVFFRTAGGDMHDLVTAVTRRLGEGALAEARTLCGQGRGPVLTLAAALVTRWSAEDDMERVIDREAMAAVARAERFGGILATIATIAPMLGLLGTVTGMMKSFSGLSRMGPAAHDLLAQGITEALVTTALGLFVAIPTMIFYNYLVTRVDRVVRDIEEAANTFYRLWDKTRRVPGDSIDAR